MQSYGNGRVRIYDAVGDVTNNTRTVNSWNIQFLQATLRFMHVEKVTAAIVNIPELPYTQIKTLQLAVVFATNTFHQFILGKESDFQTDHKPFIIVINQSKKATLRPTTSRSLSQSCSQRKDSQTDHTVHHRNHVPILVSCSWTKCRRKGILSCAVLCQIVSLLYLSRPSRHRLADLHWLFLSYGLQVVKREEC